MADYSDNGGIKYKTGKMTRVLFEKKDTYSLRGIMMLWILLSHINQMWAQEFHFELSSLMSTLMGSGGYLGTAGFFLLSGYGVFLSFSRNSPISWKYAAKNIRKILLPFFVLLVLNFIIFYYHFGSFPSIRDIGDCIQSLSFSYSFPMRRPLFANMWFLKVILIFYIVALLCFYLCDGKKRLTYITFFTAVYIVWAILFKMPAFVWMTVCCFPLGMFFAHYRDLVQNYSQTISVLSIGLFMILYFFYCVLLNAITCLLSGIMFSVAAVCFSSIVNIKCHLFDFVGHYSLLFYLFQMLFLAPSLWLSQGNVWLFMGGVFVLTFVGVYLYVLIDERLFCR